MGYVFSRSKFVFRYLINNKVQNFQPLKSQQFQQIHLKQKKVLALSSLDILIERHHFSRHGW